MKYERIYVDGSEILFGMDDNIKVHTVPELPMIEFTHNKIRYKMTDLRPLNENAVLVFERCVATAATVKDAESCKFYVPEDFDDSDNTIELITDIVTNINYEVKKKGKNGYSLYGTFLCIGCSMTTNDDGTRIIEIEFRKDNAKTIYEYWQSKGNNIQSLSLQNLVVAIAETNIKEMREWQCSQHIDTP